MKRIKQLQPLSRQHHLGLHIGRHGKQCTDTSEQIAEHWQALSSYLNDTRNHFKFEYDLLVTGLQPYRTIQPEVASILDKLTDQHKKLYQTAADIEATILNVSSKTLSTSLKTSSSLPSVTQVRELASLLYDHVRFEERELLPVIEKYLTESELDAIYDASPDNIKHLDERR